MTVKPETNFWKSLKTLLDGGDYIVSRLESYVTPGFPDCIIFHNVTGFFTVELKIVQPNNKIHLSPFQISWNSRHAIAGAHSYILVNLPLKGTVKLFHGCKTKELGHSTVDQVPGLYEGRLEDLDWLKLPNSCKNP
jgi:hypothetical protein|tara:strand:+ start:806 stop:1213 length:408 start_codon:yes stop_codon:yes gene_type:complete